MVSRLNITLTHTSMRHSKLWVIIVWAIVSYCWHGKFTLLRFSKTLVEFFAYFCHKCEVNMNSYSWTNILLLKLAIPTMNVLSQRHINPKMITKSMLDCTHRLHLVKLKIQNTFCWVCAILHRLICTDLQPKYIFHNQKSSSFELNSGPYS